MAVTHDLTHRSASTQPLVSNTMALEERFEVLKEIGDGSFGSVVLARVRSSGSNVARRGTVIAIKTMKKSFQSFTSCLELREVVFLRTLPPHQHLVPALDIFLDPFSKKLHICMEYMEGNLYQLMKARDHKCLDNASVKSILFQIMQGLEHIHAHNFFHRDIKPENILVSSSAHQETSNSFRRYSSMVTPPSTPPTYTVKIADFGLARETHSKLPYTTYVSTRWYRAPEVLLRAGEYSAPVDIWAVGAMAVEVATLKPLFPGVNEVDQLWRVCEIMGSPGNWYNKSGQRVGGGDWREGSRLAGKLGFSFPKMAPHAMDTILQTPQWPASLSQFVTWCLMWDPKTRPTSTQALAHEYFADAVDPMRPKSSASRILGRKQSDISRSSKDPVTTFSTSTKQSWFRKSLIGRSEPAPNPASVTEPSSAMPKEPAASSMPVSTVGNQAAAVPVPVAAAPVQAPVPSQAYHHQQIPTRVPVPSHVSMASPTPAPSGHAPVSAVAGPRPLPDHPSASTDAASVMSKARPAATTSKRTTWTNGPSNVAPILILPTIKPVTPISDAVTAQAANNRIPAYNDAYANSTGRQEDTSPKKLGRQLSVASSNNHYADLHRQQAEQALSGNSGLASPLSAHKESFFSHLRKRARRFSGRNQASNPPAYDEAEAQAGCGPWASNRSSMIIEQQQQQSGHMPMAVPVQAPVPVPKDSGSEALGYSSTIPAHGSATSLASSVSVGASAGMSMSNASNLKRHHSLPHHQPRSADNLHVAARGGPISSRTRRAQATQGVHQYDAPDEEDELLDEALTSTKQAMTRLEKDGKPALRQTVSSIAMSNPYPTPSPSASGNNALFADGTEAVTPKPLDHNKKTASYKWPTPPYDEGDWAASASASIWAAGNRF